MVLAPTFSKKGWPRVMILLTGNLVTLTNILCRIFRLYPESQQHVEEVNSSTVPVHPARSGMKPLSSKDRRGWLYKTVGRTGAPFGGNKFFPDTRRYFEYFGKTVDWLRRLNTYNNAKRVRRVFLCPPPLSVDFVEPTSPMLKRC